MEHVGIREFRDRATQYLARGEPLAIERHGKLVGFYIPVKQRDSEEVRQAFERLNAVMQSVLEGSGMTEEDLAEALDLSHSTTR